MRITIDGTDFTRDTQGLDEFTLTTQLNTTDNSTAISISRSLEFGGKAQEYLHSVFFDDPKASFGNRVSVNIYIECCGITEPIKFYMDHSSVELCDCTITGTLIKDEDDSECRAILRDKIFWKDNGLLDSVPFYDVPYCNDETGFTKILVILYCILLPILVVLEVIEGIINGILDVIDFLVFWKKLKWEVDIPSLDNYVDLIHGCGRKHPSPLVVDVLEYNVNRCGLEFDSKLLQVGFFKNVLLVMAQNEEGCESCKYIENNMLNKTTIQLMNDLKPVWNADYRIIDGVLYFDQKRRIKEVLKQNILCNVETEYAQGNADEPPCYEFEVNPPAYIRMQYTTDPIDLAGNKRMDTYRLDGEEKGNYSEIVEWNDPPNEYQKGEQSVIIPFSPPAFIEDGKNDCAVTIFRKLEAPRIEDRNRLVLTNGMAAYPKLILLNKADNTFDVWKQKTGEERRCRFLCTAPIDDITYDVHEYNTFLWVNENTYEGLYNQYYKYENPRGGEREMIIMQPFTFGFTCEQLQMVLKYGVNLAVLTKYGYGIPQGIEIDFAATTMTINGVRI